MAAAATWHRYKREADKLQQQVDDLYVRAEDARCSFAVSVHYSNRRCNRDVGHKGDHSIDNHENYESAE